MKLRFNNGRIVKDQTTEFMPILNDKLEKEVVSFLNSDLGGTILIGISYDGAVPGIDSCDKVLPLVMDRLRVNISPTCLGLVDAVSCESNGKTFIKVIIARGTDKPYYLRLVGMSPAGCFMRKDGVIKQMDSETVKELSEKKDMSALKNIVSPLGSDLSFAQLRIYYEEKGIKHLDDIKKALDLYEIEGRLNYAAYLLSDGNMVSFNVIKYEGTDRSMVVEDNDYGKCSLLRAADKILQKLEVENRTFTVSTSGGREVRYLLEKNALKEAVINAILHNDYSRDIMPKIEIFCDRIEISSFGVLPKDLNKDIFFEGRPMPRNRELVRVFKDLGFSGEAGSGVEIIAGRYGPEVFCFTESGLTVILPFNLDFVNAGKKDQVTEKPFIRTREKIIEILKKDPFSTAGKVAYLTGVSQKAIEWHFKKMTDSGILKREGSRKTGKWKISI